MADTLGIYLAKMRIVLAYITVVLIWATTPLAIKWSGEGPGFIFAATSRMTIGAMCMLITMMVLRKPLQWHTKAVWTYIAVAVQIFAAMMSVYWSAQYIPSGWISVIFGLAPLMTALLASMILKERDLTLSKLTAYGLGVYGLYIMFGSAVSLGSNAELGISGVLVSAFLQAGSAVCIKKIDAKLPALSQLSGGLTVALPFYFVTWATVDGQWPQDLPLRNIHSILYLGVIATTIGFHFYYYLLIHLGAVQVALISLITPVLCLLLGNLVNHEPLSQQTLVGTGYILAALVMHEVIGRIKFNRLLTKR